ncbi:MAG TPA: thermonuclease family protein [Solirubrobacterales bacterium]|nr:thermonuclease family protein [Solirubrobacterales bacterium]
MVPGIRGGTAGALALLGVLLLVLLLGGEQPDEPGSAAPERPGNGAGAAARAPATVPVLRVVDGDTIEVGIDGDPEDVRYIGVDTPETVKPGEPVQCFGPQASAFNHHLVEGETVRLVFDRELRDVYGRLLAYVYVGDRFVNAALVRGGYARTLEIPPNTARAEQLGTLEQRAGERGAGLWGAC